LENLGAGFILATHDLEIRGAGELLGEEQSGHMQTIGFSLYMELLERAIEAIKEGKEPDLTDARSEMTEVNLGISALLPEDYVPDVAIRLSLYKRIAGAKNALELRALQVELIDRFGLLPNQAKNLFTNATLKNKLSGIGVVKLESGQQKFTIEFCAEPQINTTKLIGLIQSQPGKYNLVKGTLLQINQHADNIDERLAHIETLIETLTS
jgi:transcription-repair coupling factor (superfamily II helicase)